MRNICKVLILGFIIITLAALTSCSSKHKLVPGAPDWVNEGSGAFNDAGTKVFHGVGGVTGVSSQTLAVETADQRARADIAKQLDTYVANLHRDYQTSTGASTGKQVFEEQHIEKSLKTITRISVKGARIVEHWKDPETNTIYALARLDLEGVKATMEQLDDMNPSLRNYVRSNADRAFEEIRLEERR